MYAIIETGGKQYRAEPNSILQVESLEGDVGSIIQFDSVRFVQTDQAPIVGSPMIPDAVVKGEIIRHARTRSITIFKKKRRKNYRRTKGHRQGFTQVRITEIAASV
ncbi:MAG: 50S ribosomal protein L21 [Nitrospirales bacterium]|nr:50S ribosomal protein L21 [Nitrospira sp.]MDR4460650.1 50S ribosomal protein L21 [Nitrospirales bacterium]MDR4481879.1 50S ribosomal protein L21 [Nitrospirales bacterium]